MCSFVVIPSHMCMKGEERCNYPNYPWVCVTHFSVLEPFIAFNSPTLLCYPQLPGCERQTGKNKTAGSSLLYTGWKKFWRRVCDNSFQDSYSGYLGVSMLDLAPSRRGQVAPIIVSYATCDFCCARTHFFSITEKYYSKPKKIQLYMLYMYFLYI